MKRWIIIVVLILAVGLGAVVVFSGPKRSATDNTAQTSPQGYEFSKAWNISYGPTAYTLHVTGAITNKSGKAGEVAIRVDVKGPDGILLLTFADTLNLPAGSNPMQFTFSHPYPQLPAQGSTVSFSVISSPQ